MRRLRTAYINDLIYARDGTDLKAKGWVKLEPEVCAVKISQLAKSMGTTAYLTRNALKRCGWFPYPQASTAQKDACEELGRYWSILRSDPGVLAGETWWEDHEDWE